MIRIFVCIFSILFLCFGVSADEHDQKALNQTRELLHDKESREEFIKNDKKAKSANDYANEVVGDNSKKLDEIYAISADIMGVLVEESQGDVTKMRALILEFQANPEKFFKNLTSEQRNRIQKLGRSITNKPDPN